ncbi:MAG: hypothetical protein PHQ13_12195 [Rhodoferax sp.]|nr:hypothetical protein [Rhodoferax sp.]
MISNPSAPAAAPTAELRDEGQVEVQPLAESRLEVDPAQHPAEPSGVSFVDPSLPATVAPSVVFEESPASALFTESALPDRHDVVRAPASSEPSDAVVSAAEVVKPKRVRKKPARPGNSVPVVEPAETVAPSKVVKQTDVSQPTAQPSAEPTKPAGSLKSLFNKLQKSSPPAASAPVKTPAFLNRLNKK